MLKLHSFSPERRIRQRPDFQRIFRKRNRVFSPYFILYYRLSELPHSRMGVVVSKRNIKKSVDRNRVKRISRETFRLNQSKLNSAPVDLVLVAQRQANQATNSELVICLEEFFRKLPLR